MLGVDRKGTRIFVTDPSGTYVPYAAVAIGGNSDEVTDFLEKNYKKEMSMDDAISLAISAINLKSDENGVKHIRMSKIKSDTKQFEKIIRRVGPAEMLWRLGANDGGDEDDDDFSFASCLLVGGIGRLFAGVVCRRWFGSVRGGICTGSCCPIDEFIAALGIGPSRNQYW